jgi:hypothetical protein
VDGTIDFHQTRIVIMSELAQLIKQVKTDFLPQNKVGIREFSALAGLSRSRLNQLFDGKIVPTVTHITKINLAMRKIEQRRKCRESKSLSAIHVVGENIPTELVERRFPGQHTLRAISLDRITDTDNTTYTIDE